MSEWYYTFIGGKIMRRATIYYRKTFQGAWELTAYVKGSWKSHQYMGYTKKEATDLFVRDYIDA